MNKERQQNIAKLLHELEGLLTEEQERYTQSEEAIENLEAAIAAIDSLSAI